MVTVPKARSFYKYEHLFSLENDQALWNICSKMNDKIDTWFHEDLDPELRLRQHVSTKILDSGRSGVRRWRWESPFDIWINFTIILWAAFLTVDLCWTYIRCRTYSIKVGHNFFLCVLVKLGKFCRRNLMVQKTDWWHICALRHKVGKKWPLDQFGIGVQINRQEGNKARTSMTWLLNKKIDTSQLQSDGLNTLFKGSFQQALLGESSLICFLLICL